MRVAYVCADPGIPVFGTKGASVHVREVIRAMRRRDMQVELFTARPGGTPPDDLADLAVHDLGRVSHRDVGVREQLLMDADARWRDTLDLAGPFDMVYERYALWATAGMRHAAAHGVPGVLEVNAPLVREQAAHRHLVHHAAAEQMTAAAMAAASTRIAVSEPVAAWAQQQANGRAVHVVSNGVDTDRITPQRAPGTPGFTVGFVGTLKPWHGTPVLLDAFARLASARPASRLLMVGDGPMRADLEARAARLGIADRVTFTGAVAAEEVPRLLGAMDVGMAPYPAGDHYFSPLKVYEYLAAGLPAVASRVGAMAQTIDDGVTGVLTRPGDVAGMALALMRLHDDPAARRRMGAAAREQAVARHTWDHALEQILNAAAAERPQPILAGAVS